MTNSTIYPPADKTTQWWENDFIRGRFSRIEKILLHSTETTGWPGYQSGALAPTLTYHVKQRKWRQHNYLNTSARALGDPASTPVRENRDNVIQIELIWYAKDAASLPDSAYEDLAAFINYVRSEWGGPELKFANFVGLSEAPNVHMTSAQYDSFNGILGHQHVPKPSSHWDPGAIDSTKLARFIKGTTTPVTPTPVEKDEFDMTPAERKALINDIKDAVWADIPWEGKPGYPGSSAGNNLGAQSAIAVRTETLVKSLIPRVAAIEAAIAGDTDVEAFKAAAQEAFENALKSSLDVTVTPK